MEMSRASAAVLNLAAPPRRGIAPSNCSFDWRGVSTLERIAGSHGLASTLRARPRRRVPPTNWEKAEAA